MLFLRLSIVFGLNWLFEGIIFAIEDKTVKLLFSILNGLIGVIIFLLFVVKRSVLIAIKKKYVSICAARNNLHLYFANSICTFSHCFHSFRWCGYKQTPYNTSHNSSSNCINETSASISSKTRKPKHNNNIRLINITRKECL